MWLNDLDFVQFRLPRPLLSPKKKSVMLSNNFGVRDRGRRFQICWHSVPVISLILAQLSKFSSVWLLSCAMVIIA